MSWSINIIGKPSAVAAELAKHAESLSGESRREFEAALPSLVALCHENFANGGGYTEPVLVLEASGHGTAVPETARISLGRLLSTSARCTARSSRHELSDAAVTQGAGARNRGDCRAGAVHPNTKAARGGLAYRDSAVGGSLASFISRGPLGDYGTHPGRAVSQPGVSAGEYRDMNGEGAKVPLAPGSPAPCECTARSTASGRRVSRSGGRAGAWGEQPSGRRRGAGESPAFPFDTPKGAAHQYRRVIGGRAAILWRGAQLGLCEEGIGYLAQPTTPRRQAGAQLPTAAGPAPDPTRRRAS